MYLLLHPDYYFKCLCLLICGFSGVFFPVLWLSFLFLLLFLCSTVISEYWGQCAGKKSSTFVQVQRERLLECSSCWEYPWQIYVPERNCFSACWLSLCESVRSWGKLVRWGTRLWPEGGDGFLGKLLAEKMPPLRCLLLGGQPQAKGGAWLFAEVAKIGRDSWLGVHGQVLCPSPPPLSSWEAIFVPPPVSPCLN